MAEISTDRRGRTVLLSHRPGSGTPFRLGDTAAFDACTVLPMSAVTDAGIELDPRLTVVQTSWSGTRPATRRGPA